MRRRLDELDPLACKILLVVVAMAEERPGTIEIREVAARAGASVGATHERLTWLRDAKLVSWRHRAAGTLQPRVGRAPIRSAPKRARRATLPA